MKACGDRVDCACCERIEELESAIQGLLEACADGTMLNIDEAGSKRYEAAYRRAEEVSRGRTP